MVTRLIGRADLWNGWWRVFKVQLEQTEHSGIIEDSQKLFHDIGWPTRITCGTEPGPWVGGGVTGTRGPLGMGLLARRGPTPSK